MKLLCVCLLLALLSPSLAKEKICVTSASSCDECIASGPDCAWCMAPHAPTRCGTMKELHRAGCHGEAVYNPRGEARLIINGSSSSETKADKPVFPLIKEVLLRLRPGVKRSFSLPIALPADHPPVDEPTMDTSPVPPGVNITFRKILTGNPVVVEVSLQAARCPDVISENSTGPWFVDITPQGFSQTVKLEIELECKCPCTRIHETRSEHCFSRGSLVCGQCECYKPYVGELCQRDGELSVSSDDAACRPAEGAAACSGRGACVDGVCECDKRLKPEEAISGAFCECSNYDCPYSNNKICGGHGRCECGQCVCEDSWTGDDCRCSMETASCMAQNQRICNGRGTCQCGACKCEPPYTGPTCEDCPRCEGVCARHAACVECLAFGTGDKKDRCEQDCSYLSVTKLDRKSEMPEIGGATSLCKMMSSDDQCFFHYAFTSTPSGGQASVLKAKVCPLS